MDFVTLPANPRPEGARFHDIAMPGGVHLRAASWLPAGKARGTVLLLQGRAEMVEKYFEVVGELLCRGFAVASFDWRGQGGSSRLAANPLKGHVGTFADYEADLAAVITKVMLPACPPPYVALAHSTGALVLLHHLARGHATFERAVLVAPLLELGRLYPPQRIVGPLATALAAACLSAAWPPGAAAARSLGRGFEGNPLTGDARRFGRMLDIFAARPGLAVGAPTIGWLAAVSRAMADAALPRFAAAVRLPVLIVSGDADIVVAPAATARLAARLPDAQALVIPGARHEILMERDDIRAVFWSAFDVFMAWEDGRLPAPGAS